MSNSILIKGGTIVDGTGAPVYPSDIRVTDGKIVAIGENLKREGRERVVDADGCLVTPGFIESHNHFDAIAWWLPSLEPMPGYGVTTSINGNCGFTVAPISGDPETIKEVVKVFSFIEDIPQKPFLSELPWDWSSWSEYRKSFEQRIKIPVNWACFVGHVTMRLTVMGKDAWTRAANDEEIAEMCVMLEDGLAAGALGLSSNLLDFDAHDRPIPPRNADVREWAALFEVVERHEGATVQLIVDTIARNDAPHTLETIIEAAGGKDIRLQVFNALPTGAYAAPRLPGAHETLEKMREAGLDVWPGYSNNTVTLTLNFNSTLIFAQSRNYAWAEVIEAEGKDAKFALLEDPAWRQRARESWNETLDQSPIKNPNKIDLLESETGAGPIGVTLREYMEETGLTEPSDALAEWVLDNGPGSILRLAPLPRHEETIDHLLHDPKTVGNATDAGAHGQMFCGIGDNVALLTDFVRERGQLSIEEAVHIMTGKVAGHFDLHDRGVLAVGKAADIVVFDLAGIERRPEKKAWDVPDGEGGLTYRWSREAAPMVLTLVNGEPTFDHGDFTGRYPGRVVSPVAA